MISSDQAFMLLESHFPVLRKVIEGGWDFWSSLTPRQRLTLDIRAQRSVTWCGMIETAVQIFDSDPGVTVIEGENTTYFSFGGEAIVRFKKLDRSGTSANVMTQTQLDLRDPQVELPGEFGKLPLLDVGYVPNQSEDGFDAILVAAPGDSGSTWNFAIPSAASAPETLPLASGVEKPVVRPIAPAERDADTGTEGR